MDPLQLQQQTEAVQALKEIAASLKEIKEEMAGIRASVTSFSHHLVSIAGALRK
jgi:hypothetical protein